LMDKTPQFIPPLWPHQKLQTKDSGFELVSHTGNIKTEH